MTTDAEWAREIIDGWGHRIGSGPEDRVKYLAQHLDAAEQRGIDSCKSACEATVRLCEKTLRDIQEAP